MQACSSRLGVFTSRFQLSTDTLNATGIYHKKEYIAVFFCVHFMYVPPSRLRLWLQYLYTTWDADVKSPADQHHQAKQVFWTGFDAMKKVEGAHTHK